MTAVFASVQTPFPNAPHVLERVYDQQTRQRLEAHMEFPPPLTSIEELESRKEEWRGVDIMFSTWGAPQLTKEQIRDIFPNLKVIFYAAGSVQYFAEPYLECGVRIFSAADANAIPVIDYTVSLILLANKGFYQAARFYSGGDYEAARAYAGHFSGNYGAAVGIIGAGKIGRGVIKKLREHHLTPYVYDPFLSPRDARALEIETCPLEKLFDECLVISNHLADNDRTKAMLNYRLFKRMHSYATFINTGRGAQVVERDLAHAMRERPTRTAILDVTFPEPVEPRHSFFDLPNIILTPHIAGSMGDETARMGVFMADAYEEYMRGELSIHEVTAEMLPTMA